VPSIGQQNKSEHNTRSVREAPEDSIGSLAFGKHHSTELSKQEKEEEVGSEVLAQSTVIVRRAKAHDAKL
jgi:hypothetical protein